MDGGSCFTLHKETSFSSVVICRFFGVAKGFYSCTNLTFSFPSAFGIGMAVMSSWAVMLFVGYTFTQHFYKCHLLIKPPLK